MENNNLKSSLESEPVTLNRNICNLSKARMPSSYRNITFSE